MANSFITIDMATREALRLLENELVLAKIASRPYEDEFAKNGYQVGDTIRVRKLPKFVVESGEAITTLNDINEGSDTITVDQRYKVAFGATRQQFTLSINDFSKNILRPAISALAHYIDLDLMTVASREIANQVGVIGTSPASDSVILDAGVKLTENAAPLTDRVLLLSPKAHASMVAAYKTTFNPTSDVSGFARNGRMGGKFLGFDDWHQTQQVYVHTVGSLGGTPLVNGGSQTGPNINIDGASNSITGWVKKGDVVQFAGVNRVDPNNRQDTGTLMDFVITADANSNGSGVVVLPIYPTMVASGKDQNVTALPADNAAVSVFSVAAAGQAAIAGKKSPQHLAMHPEAFAFTMVPLHKKMLQGAEASTQTNAKSGLSLSMVMQYNISTDQTICRIDALWGRKAIRRELGCRIIS